MTDEQIDLVRKVAADLMREGDNAEALPSMGWRYNRDDLASWARQHGRQDEATAIGELEHFLLTIGEDNILWLEIGRVKLLDLKAIESEE